MNIGVAAAIDEGLIVPVVHQAGALSIREIAARLSDLSARARKGQLRPEDVQGGTFTISNLGMFGVDRFTAILNPPEAAILAVSRAAKRPVVTDDDRIEIQLLADFTLTADHRVRKSAPNRPSAARLPVSRSILRRWPRSAAKTVIGPVEAPPITRSSISVA